MVPIKAIVIYFQFEIKDNNEIINPDAFRKGAIFC